MADIRIGEKVINTKYGTGSIVSFASGIITVDFQGKDVKFMQDAFEKGFLKYENPAVQEILNEAKRQEAEKAAQILAAKEKSAAERQQIQAELSKAHRRITVLSATFRLDPAPITMTSVRKKDQDLIREIFAQCDQETQALFQFWKPNMEYLDRTSHGRSKYCIGFLCKYADTYVFRLFSRNDLYRKDAQKFITVTNSNTSEVLRVLRVNGKLYYFSKNLTGAGEYLVNTKGNGNWHISDLNSSIMVNQVIRNCDCAYLNDHIAVSDIDCLQYLKLLFSGLYNNKAEIVLKHQLFSSAHRIENIETYLDAFTHKQITVACTYGALNALPFIARYGPKDPHIHVGLETLLRKKANGQCTYSVLENHLSRLGLHCPDLDKKVLAFLKKLLPYTLRTRIYEDYINMLADEPDVTLADFFDKDYLDRHWALQQQKTIYHSPREATAYAQEAQALSWIDREENDYFIIVPKTVEEFCYEGAHQHNCVYTNKYYQAVIAHQSIIVFLRKEKDIPYVTIEYDYETFDVWQAYGKYNRPIPPDLYEYVVNLGKRLNYEMRSHQ